MTELWVPYGAVETLVSIQAENLGSVAESVPEKTQSDLPILPDLVKEAAMLLVCDSVPSTIGALKSLSQTIASTPTLRIVASAPKPLESAVPDLKGKIYTLPPPIQGSQSPVVYSPDIMGEGRKVFLGTGRPDPLFGVLDAQAEACMNWVAGSLPEAVAARSDMEPAPFARTASYDKMQEFASKIPGSEFLTIVPRGGRASDLSHGAPFEALRDSFLEVNMPVSKGLILGAGGAGYDDTLSSSIRAAWGALPALRPSGHLLLVAECSGGLGSAALQMLATGRMGWDAAKRRTKYVEGLEEIHYLNKLKEDYEVLILTGLPEVYLKSKLGISTARGSGEAVGRLLNKAGRSAKVNVVARAGECRVVAS